MRKIFIGIVGFLIITATAQATSEHYAKRSAELVRAGNLAAGQQDWDGAILMYERAVTADPKNVQAYYRMGQAFEQVNRPGRALKFYRTALSIEPNHLPTLEAQALALLKKDNVQKAEAALSKIKRICGGNGCDETSTVNEAIKEYLAVAVTPSGDDGTQ